MQHQSRVSSDRSIHHGNNIHSYALDVESINFSTHFSFSYQGLRTPKSPQHTEVSCGQAEYFVIRLTQTTPQRVLSPQSCRRCRWRSSPWCWQTTALLAPCLPSFGAVEKPMTAEKTPQEKQSTSEGTTITSSAWYRPGQLRVALFLFFECPRRTPQSLLPSFAKQESISKCGPQPHRK